MSDRVWSTYLRFNRRLQKIGIEIECFNNMPWIYLRSINGKTVTERYLGEHGFTAFWYPANVNDVVKFTDRRKVFELIRKYA